MDDGRKPGLVERLLKRFNPPTLTIESASLDLDSYNDRYVRPPSQDTGSIDLTPLSITIPAQYKPTLDQAEQFLLHLQSASQQVSFEIVGQSDRIQLQMTPRTSDLPLVRNQFRAHFPDAMCLESEDRLVQSLCGDGMVGVLDIGLSEEFMRPLLMLRDSDPDPYVGLLAAFDNLKYGETGAIQMLLSGVRHPWHAEVMRSVLDWEGRPFFADAPDAVPLAERKVERPFFALVLRVIGKANNAERVWEIIASIAGSLGQYSDPPSNALVPLEDDDYPDDARTADIVFRTTHRSGMLLNSRELVSLIHLPSQSVRSEKLVRAVRKTRAAPPLAHGHAYILGENVHQGECTLVTLNTEQRFRHVYVIGATGTGKSTLLQNLILQDIEQGHGVAVLDPHGDLVDRVVGHIPDSRLHDVIYLDPSDPQFPLGLNILSAHSENERTVLASDLVAVFRRLSTSWGDQMTTVFGNAVLAFLESDEGGTLVDLRRFLVEADYRKSFLLTVRDPEIVYYWQKEFPLLTGKPQASILTRLDTFLRPKAIRTMVRQKDGLNFERIMNGRGILLAKLSQGLIGEENAYLLGTLIVSKLHQAAMARQSLNPADRPPFFCYIDEFQNFLTPSMTAILSGARKYHLGLILAHQELRQLWNRDTEVANSVISNPGTRICFRLGDFDAQKLADGFSNFDAQNLQNLGTGEAVCRIERPEYDFSLNVFPPKTVSAERTIECQDRLKVLSFEKYGCALEETVGQPVKAETQTTIPASLPASHPTNGVLPPPRRPVFIPPEDTPIVEKVDTPEPRMEGKGGPQHKYLQSIIKRMAEEKGYRATLEQPTLDGQGQIDVSLERDGKRIAVEISVTTGSEHEVGNIEKCLRAGYDTVILCSPEKRTLERVEGLVSERLSEADREKINFFQPEEMILFFEAEAAPQNGTENVVKGYRVKVNYAPVSETEKKVKREAITQVMMQTMRRMKTEA